MTLLSYLFQNIGYLENIDDNDITKQVRLRAIKWACIIDDKFFKNTIDFKLNQHLVDELYRMSPEHNFMYCIDLMAANRTTWDKILELYQKTDPKEENFKTMLLKSLSCSENSDIIINYLNITTFNTLLFHEKERSFIIKSILDKHLNNTLILDYILNNFETIKPKSLTTTEIIKLILGNVFYDKQIDKMKVFSDANFAHDPITRNAIKKLIQKRENFLKKSLESFKKYFF
ncbi:PREDICTED: uncharacterized protein LOC105153490 [Acromyrmex echinatior]|uniref:uncharacterized protein LOC105153490 n=1 Tax=Acromyrmex echinatior TaxID=103372 RepID=UPI000580B9B1|nr:PREDICTED: uncharacterized protein LOC105153490 [Acromyrmex echinatior]